MNKIKVFENKKVRTAWNEETEDWFFSVIDVIEILTESENPRDYWKVLKYRLAKEGSELVTNCNRFGSLLYKTMFEHLPIITS